MRKWVLILQWVCMLCALPALAMTNVADGCTFQAQNAQLSSKTAKATLIQSQAIMPTLTHGQVAMQSQNAQHVALTEGASYDAIALAIAELSEVDIDEIILPAGYDWLPVISHHIPEFSSVVYLHKRVFWLDRPPQSTSI